MAAKEITKTLSSLVAIKINNLIGTRSMPMAENENQRLNIAILVTCQIYT